MSHFARRTSHVARRTSHVACRMSHVSCRMLLVVRTTRAALPLDRLGGAEPPHAASHTTRASAAPEAVVDRDGGMQRGLEDDAE